MKAAFCQISLETHRFQPPEVELSHYILVEFFKVLIILCVYRVYL